MACENVDFAARGAARDGGADWFACSRDAIGNMGDALSNTDPTGLDPTIGLLAAGAVIVFLFLRNLRIESSSSGGGGLLPKLAIVGAVAYVLLNGGL